MADLEVRETVILSTFGEVYIDLEYEVICIHESRVNEIHISNMIRLPASNNQIQNPFRMILIKKEDITENVKNKYFPRPVYRDANDNELIVVEPNSLFFIINENQRDILSNYLGSIHSIQLSSIMNRVTLVHYFPPEVDVIKKLAIEDRSLAP